MKRRSLLAKKIQDFRTGKMRLQTDRKFQQIKIKQLKEYNVDVYSPNHFHHYSYYNWPRYTNAVFRNEEDHIYNKLLRSSYNIFNAPDHH